MAEYYSPRVAVFAPGLSERTDVRICAGGLFVDERRGIGSLGEDFGDQREARISTKCEIPAGDEAYQFAGEESVVLIGDGHS